LNPAPAGDVNFDEVSRQRIITHTMLKRATTLPSTTT
jgi:hypothetical protein